MSTLNRRSLAPTILVVDSNPITLLGIAGVLHSLGNECICARSPEAALTAVQSSVIELVVLDVGEDAEGALELAERLRGISSSGATSQDSTSRDAASTGPSAKGAANSRGVGLPILFLADVQWAGLEKRTESLKNVRCLYKPLDPRVLGDVVSQSLWVQALAAQHRQRGHRPAHPGWVQL